MLEEIITNFGRKEKNFLVINFSTIVEHCMRVS